MESFLKADRKDPKPEIVTPADYLCNLCDGNDKGLYAKVLRESEEVEAEISEEAKQRMATWSAAECERSGRPQQDTPAF